jgi:CubicO group peptidase (beta-lactamase class C family)
VTFLKTSQVLDAALAAGAAPAVAIDVGRCAAPLWQSAAGRLSTLATDDQPATIDTVFDLASLTKVIATTSLAMRLVGDGRLDLDAPIGTWLDGWDSAERRGVRVRHLLDHSSGLPAHGRFWEVASGRQAYERVLLELPLVHAPGAASVYSDPGFILLGFIIEDAGGAPLSEQFDRFAHEAALGEIRYGSDPRWHGRIAPTEVDPWRGRLLLGDVHDENAAALGGVAAHAGLFGTAPAVGAFARLVLRSFREPTAIGPPDLMHRFAACTRVPNSSRALGWDTMLPTSSCGTRLSRRAIGHTGFTGTSLWIDPEQDLYVVLLSNRVHPTRANDRFAAVRPQVHDAVVEDLESSLPWQDHRVAGR